MSLATRCTGCGTAFRVVQDQLRVSEGWVRCGQCREVFNALEQLFDLERDGSSAVAADAGPDASRAAAEPPAAESADAPSESSTAIDADASETPAPSLPQSPEAREMVETTAPMLHAGQPEIAVEPATAGQIDEATTVHEQSALIALGPASLEDDESPLLPALQTDAAPQALADDRDSASFLAPELGVDVEGDDTIRLPDAPGDRTIAPSAAEPDAAADEWAAEAAHDRPSPSEKDIDAHLFGKRRHARRHAPVAHVSARDQIDFSDARFDSNILTEEEALDGAPATEEGSAGDPIASAEQPATPDFLRRAERQARWQRRPLRVALAATAAGLCLLLGLQALHHFRDDLAARSVGLKTALAAWCALAACTLQAPRHIEEITVESTALARASADAFRLAVTLRNHSAIALALPAVDLSLTDATGRLVARRALFARDFKLAAAVLPPKGEIVLEAPIATRNARVSGYTVEIFYP